VWAMRVSAAGNPLPSARVVSSVLLPEGNHPSPTHNLMFMQFGQFIAHDTSAGVMFASGNNTGISCCTEGGVDQLHPKQQHWACAPITAVPDDPFYGFFGQKCLNFVRTQLAPASDCSVGYAKQMNGATHYPDLSHLYGTFPEKLSLVRGEGGFLKTFNDFGRALPPLTKRRECVNMDGGSPCFES
ncbi:chorion peroxidase-like, partial [Bombyx mandarina]|uniref:Chorion peroxidase-like n=1 Tax=Bombyx mandarina TaxID=7092 RepID=A0A6J2KJW5_BOMMA